MQREEFLKIMKQTSSNYKHLSGMDKHSYDTFVDLLYSSTLTRPDLTEKDVKTYAKFFDSGIVFGRIVERGSIAGQMAEWNKKGK